MAEVSTSPADRLGFAAGQVVLEIGYDEDVDDALRAAIEAKTGSELVDEDYEDDADAVVLWYRDDDGDLTDLLVDAIGFLAGAGTLWLFTPKTGRAGYVEPSDIADAAMTAGLARTSSATVAPDWSGTRLVSPKR
ncbi:DUF3052 domain-containing protein [Nocardia harenae]|uniref:DUF3052 domain-containing protein n=1 Tax=Nocardia harenae TaxID=358707 RepID=UPI000A513CB8|nr:DUF3052 domain-containing protein [Nocardia harenae]